MTNSLGASTDRSSDESDAALAWTLNPPIDPQLHGCENICDSWPHEGRCDWCDDQQIKTVRYLFDASGHPVLGICQNCYVGGHQTGPQCMVSVTCPSRQHAVGDK